MGLDKLLAPRMPDEQFDVKDWRGGFIRVQRKFGLRSPGIYRKFPSPPPAPQPQEELEVSEAHQEQEVPLSSDIPSNVPAVQHDQLTVRLIIDVVCRRYGLQKNNVIGSSRKKDLVRPRQVICYLSRRLVKTPSYKKKVSYPEIGRRLGGRDHSTIMHGEMKTRELMSNDSDFKSFVKSIESELRALCR
ncbi:MAG TPA: helix-turn-helix domain-containing protein [Candidatus Paceibacterota bacterium]|nr:helix-turn-helix domain-containing protein [Candidatus Paceibacterota bacterium]